MGQAVAMGSNDENPQQNEDWARLIELISEARLALTELSSHQGKMAVLSPDALLNNSNFLSPSLAEICKLAEDPRELFAALLEKHQPKGAAETGSTVPDSDFPKKQRTRRSHDNGYDYLLLACHDIGSDTKPTSLQSILEAAQFYDELVKRPTLTSKLQKWKVAGDSGKDFVDWRYSDDRRITDKGRAELKRLKNRLSEAHVSKIQEAIKHVFGVEYQDLIRK